MKKHSVILYLIMWFFMSLLSLNVHAGGEKKPHTLESQIDSIFSDITLDKPGLALAIVKNGNVIFKKGYGSANLEYNIPITPSSVFNIASVSKQFTAMCIVLLAQQNKLTFDDDVRQHIPEFPDFGATITIRHLIHHTSEELGVDFVLKLHEDAFPSCMKS